MNGNALQFSVKSSGWHLVASQSFSQRLQAKVAQPAGWFRIYIKPVNTAAARFISEGGQFYLTQNDEHAFMPLLSAKSGQHLVLLRHQPLTSLTLHWHSLTDGIACEATFTIKLGRVNAAVAWLQMLQYVAKQRVLAGEKASRIYVLTRARIKRWGKQHALRKLVQEYHPLLLPQLISCDPYSFWRQQREPALFEPIITAGVRPHRQFELLVQVKGDREALQRTLESILLQQHPNWRLTLCVARGIALPVLPGDVMSDRRIVVSDSPSLLAGSWVLLLNEGDCLANAALQSFELAIKPNAALVYSDHDVLSLTLLREQPNFKPQWSPDFFFHHNYLGPSVLFNSDRFKATIEDTEWWQQPRYLLTARLLNALSVSEQQTAIQHLPLVLLHQFVANIELALSETELTSLTTELQQLAAKTDDKIVAVRQAANARLLYAEYALPEPAPLVSLLIPTRDALAITRTCVESILTKTAYQHFEIIILDNQSVEEDTLAWFAEIAQHDKVRVLRYDYPFNYSAINNFGVSQAKGSVIGLVNNDTEVINPQWLTEMLQHACRPSIGCVGAKLYYFDNTVQHGGVILGLWGLAGHSHKNYMRFEPGHQYRLQCVHNLSAVTAACLLVRKEVYLAAGGLEETHLTVAFNDVDFCLKVQALGYRNLWTPYAELYHYESKTRGKEDTPEKKAREQREIAYMRQKWPAVIANDPYYNPNLTRHREDFSLDID